MTLCSVRILVGRSLDEARGEVVACQATPGTVLAELRGRAHTDRPDAWAILAVFDDDRRGKDRWEAAGGVMVDLDWEDPQLPAEEGAHHPIPDRERHQIIAALREYPISGFAYLTPRGLRWGCVLSDEVTVPLAYEELVGSAGGALLAHLAEFGIPLWRDGRTGLRYDAASGKPGQAMRLPLPDAPALVTGRDEQIKQIDLRDQCPRLGLDQALEPRWAEAVRDIASSLQVPEELVAAELLVLFSALIGNTRAVRNGDRCQNLSLQVLSLLESGSGKSDLRKFLGGHLDEIEDALEAEREEAIRRVSEQQAELRRWQRAAENPRAHAPGDQPTFDPRKTRTKQCFQVNDQTAEGLGAVLRDTPRGVLLAGHEAHVVISHGKYGTGSSKAASEKALFRSWFDGQDTNAVRKGELRVQRIERPFAAASLDAQPGIEKSLFDAEDAISGSLARWFIHRPTDLAGSVQYRDIPPIAESTRRLINQTVRSLWGIHLAENEQGRPVPLELGLSTAAKDAYVEWLERMEAHRGRAHGAERALRGHARGKLLRIAAVLAALRDTRTTVIEEVDVTRATAWIAYFIAHHRRIWANEDHEAEVSRLDSLGQAVERIHERQRERGVRPSDLRARVNKARYGGQEGERRAIADLHAIGWVVGRVPVAPGRPGRRPVPAFFPPGARKPSAKSDQSRSKGRRGDLADFADHSVETAVDNGAEGARILLDRASSLLIGRGDVVLPRPGTRVHCPACGSPDGLGVLPDEATRWYCHSDRHSGPRTGCAVDYLLAERLERMPSPAEAVAEARRALGEEPRERSAKSTKLPPRSQTALTDGAPVGTRTDHPSASTKDDWGALW